MKLGVLWGVGVLVAGMATAQVFQPITSAQMADVNSKIIKTDDLHLKTIPYQSSDTSLSPFSDQRVECKSADAGAPVNVLDLPWRTTDTVPQQNFTAKYAVRSDQKAPLPEIRPAAGVLPSHAAPISKRVIRAFTPTGEQQLKKQLQKLPLEVQGK